MRSIGKKIGVIPALILAIWAVGYLLQACVKPSGCGNVPAYFSPNQVQLEAYQYTTTPSLHISKLTDSAAVPATEYLLRLVFHNDYHSSFKPFEYHFCYSSIARAPCPSPGEAGADQSLKSITIITLNKLNDQFEAGDTINSICRLDGKEISEYVPAWENRDVPWSDLYFTQAIDTEAWHRLRIHLEFEKVSLTAESKTFRLIP